MQARQFGENTRTRRVRIQGIVFVLIPPRSPPSNRIQHDKMKPSEEICSENKKIAARRAAYGSSGGGDTAKGRGSSGKPPLNPSGKPGESGAGRRRKSSLAAYLQREGVSVHADLPDGTGTGGGERIPPTAAGTSRKRRASGTGIVEEEDNDDQERRAGGGVARWSRYSKPKGSGSGGGDGRTPTPTPERGADSSSEDESSSSITIPGLSGVLVTQLTWGAGSGAWDAALQGGAQDGAGGGAGGGAAAAGTDAPDRREGLVGTTALGEISGSTSKSGAEAERTGVGGPEKDRASGRDAHSRRLTYTEVSSSSCTTRLVYTQVRASPYIRGVAGTECSSAADSFTVNPHG